MGGAALTNLDLTMARKSLSKKAKKTILSNLQNSSKRPNERENSRFYL
jgi:hypothetical protein